MPVDVKKEPALLKVLGDPVRWEIVLRLTSEELCVCHLVDALDLAQPLVSHHLRVLRDAGLVRPERAGTFTYYLLERDVLRGLAGEIGRLAAPPRRPRRRPCA